MDIFIERTQQTKKKKFQGKVSVLLQELRLNPEEVLVTRNEELVTEHDKLANTDTVAILSVISGG